MSSLLMRTCFQNQTKEIILLLHILAPAGHSTEVNLYIWLNNAISDWNTHIVLLADSECVRSYSS